MKKPIRIDESLFEAAVSAAESQNRTATAQLELWAQVGRETLERRESAYKKFTSSLAEMNSMSFQRRVEEAVFKGSGFAYVVSERGDQFVDRVYEDGRRITGQLIDGKFRACDDKN